MKSKLRLIASLYFQYSEYILSTKDVKHNWK